MTKTYVPYFDTEIEIDHLATIGDVGTANAAASSALNSFLGLTVENRRADTRHVYAYYRDVRQAVAKYEDRELDMGVVETAEAVWAHVTPTQIFLQTGRGDDPHCYVIAECECEWEAEHGLMMVWRDGAKLCKASDYDGHITNADAYDDDTLKDVVYPGIDKEFRTFAGD